MKKKILIILFLTLEIYLLYDAKDVINTFTKLLNIILYSLMPTMFFSVLFSNILIKLNFYDYIPNFIINFISKLFNISKEEVIIFFLSMLSGYPNNSKMLINNINLNNIILYTNFINPIFFFCTVSNIYLKNQKLSLIIYISHIITNIIIALLVRNKNIVVKKELKNNKNDDIYFSSLKETINTLVNIFTNILFFSILISLISNIIKNTFITSILIGIIEFSSGIYSISNLDINIFLKGLFILIIINFGSFSIHAQIISLNEKIKYKKYFIFKLLSIIVGTIFYIILYNLI